MPYYESPYRTIKRAVLAEREAELAASGGSPADVQMGIAWWNGLTRKERMTVLTQAGQHKHDPSVADTWHLWKAGVVSTEPENREVSDGGPLTHESPAAQSRRSLH